MVKKNTDKATLKQVLGQIPEDELRKFIEKQLNKQEFKAAFLKAFGDYFVKKESADVYVDQVIDAYVDAIDEDYGYMSFRNQSELYGKIYYVLETADKFRDKGDFEAAIDIYFQVLRENVKAINHNDDSYGNLGMIMRRALDGLNMLVDEDVCSLDEDSRLYFIESCWDVIDDNVFDGWDWPVNMYEFLVDLVKNDDECEEVFNAIDEDAYFESQWHRPDGMRIKRNVLAKWKGADAAHEFVLANLENKEFREEAIKDALDGNDCAGAYKLCTEAIEKEKSKGERVSQSWYLWMLRTAQKECRKDVIIESASMLYLDSFGLKEDFYGIMKTTVPVDKWDEFALRLAQKALDMGKQEMYADICVREKWTARLYEHVKSERTIGVWNQYYTALIPKYKDEVADYFISYACGILNRYHLDRKSYKELCNYLVKAAEVGGKDKVDRVRAELATKHRNRPALRDELNKMEY